VVADPITQFLAEVIHQRDGLQADLPKHLTEPEQFTEGAEGWALPGLMDRLIPECRNRFRAAYSLAAAYARQERAGLPVSRLAEALDAVMEQHELLLEAYAEAAADRRQFVPSEIRIAHAQAATRLLQLWPTAEAGDDAPQPDAILDADGADNCGQADSKADSKKKSSPKLPENPEVSRLINRLNQNRDSGRSKIDIAREFTDGDEKGAKNLLRQTRRFRG
jgi:hypothetical protein